MKFSWLWPEIVDIKTAQQAAKYGYWAAIWVVGFSAAVASIAIISSTEFNFLDGGAYVDAALFAVVAWRIKQYSRIFAIVGTLLFVLEKIIFMHVLTAFDWVQTVFLLLLFIHGIRGVFTYNRFLRLSVSINQG